MELYILTDGDEVLDWLYITDLEAEEKNQVAQEATDDNILWQRA